MGILSNTVSISQFRVVGDKPTVDFFTWVDKCLESGGFRSIERNSDEISMGWVRLDNAQDSEFGAGHTCQKDHYLAFTLRRDQRRLSSALIKYARDEAEADFLEANPHLQHIPKQKRLEIRELVRNDLLTRTLPSPATFDVVWDTRNDLVTFACLSSKTIDLFMEEFKKTFEGLRLVPVHPFARARAVIPEQLVENLARANRADSDAVMDMVKENRWLGCDFLLWLLYQTQAAGSEYRISQPGPANNGETFVAYINHRMTLAGASEEGPQRVSVTGPQVNFSEVRAALRDGKEILQAGICFETQEDTWKLVLKGDMFHFSSFKSPPVKIEKDDLTDPQLEFEAVFFERMLLLEKGIQMFDSLLAAFLSQRLGETWQERSKAIQNWVQEG
ncbi:MAG: recombination-associated protein RdgC [Deltaproteobacteria bacterium]|nr:recombination-associated protein RdgC [Deltaproteobacteria bacterium]